MPTVIITPGKGAPFPFRLPDAHDTRPAVEALVVCAKARTVAERRVAVGVRVAQGERKADTAQVA